MSSAVVQDQLRAQLLAPSLQPLTTTPVFSNCIHDYGQRHDYFSCWLSEIDLHAVERGMLDHEWSTKLMSAKLGIALECSQKGEFHGSIPRQETEFGLKVLGEQQSMGWLDYTLICVKLTAVDQTDNGRETAPARVLFFPYPSQKKFPHDTAGVFEFDSVMVPLFSNATIILLQAKVFSNEGPPSLTRAIRSHADMDTAANPLCRSAPAGEELCRFMEVQREQQRLASSNMVLVDANEVEYPAVLQTMASTCKRVSRLFSYHFYEKPHTCPFKWDKYTETNPFRVPVPFPLGRVAVRMVLDLATYGRVSDYLMCAEPKDFVRALELSKYLEMPGITNALAYLSTMTILFNSHRHGIEELIRMLTTILNCMSVEEFLPVPARRGCSNSTLLPGALQALILLGFIGSQVAGIGQATGELEQPEMAKALQQTIHCLTLITKNE